MKMTRVFAMTIGALALAVAAHGQAANLNFLNSTPITYLKKKDKAALYQAVGKALNESKDGDTVGWSNQGLGNSVAITSEITAANTSKTDSGACRDLRLVLHAKGQDQTLALKLCNKGDTGWVIQKQ